MRNADEVVLKDPRITKIQREEEENLQHASGYRPELFKPKHNNFVVNNTSEVKQNNIENNRITFCCLVM